MEEIRKKGTRNLDTKLHLLKQCPTCETMFTGANRRGFESSEHNSSYRTFHSRWRLANKRPHTIVESYSVINNSAKRHTNGLNAFKSVISTFILVLIFCSSLVKADPELLQRQFSSSVYASNSKSNQQSQPALHFTISNACNLECKSAKLRPFCASDGKTYTSKCEIRKVVKCEKRHISIVSKGSCGKEKDTSVGRTRTGTNCHQQLREIARTYSKSDEVFRPSCHSNGTYTAVQCFHGYCWCVKSDGTPIPRTSKKNAEPDCTTGPDRQKKKRRVPENSQKCTRYDRTQFNYKLFKLFASEFARLPESQSKAGVVEGGEKPGIIEWKYEELDKNQDGVLNGIEVKTLNRLVRKGVKPRKCAKRFPNYCDENRDGAITAEEWSTCLDDNSLPGQDRGIIPRPDASGGNSPPLRHSSNPTQSRETQSAMSFLALLVPNNGGVSEDGGKIDIIPQSPDRPESDMPSSSTDCFEERTQAEENDKNHPNGQIFVPDCLDGGQYKKEQCHKYTGYCWCVDESTGMPIPGYSTHNEPPNCTDAKPERVMKGCSYPQKKMFLTQVLDMLSSEMVAFAENNPDDVSKIPMDPDQRLEERAVRWKFAMMDSNSNNELSRKETKEIKDIFSNTTNGQPKLRKCARNFLRFCDENADTKINTEEWVSCLKLIESQSDNKEESRVPKGTNPLTHYLKS